jgi:AAA+ ATPase superfamily predicted ATPase
MQFEISTPVTNANFFNREKELDRLLFNAQNLTKGISNWVAILGHRKVGKSSLLWELRRRLPARIHDVYVDCWSLKIDPKSFFAKWITEIINAFLIKSRQALKTGLVQSYSAATVARLGALRIETLNRAVELLEALNRRAYSHDLFEDIIDLPEKLAQETGAFFLVIVDEFPELAALMKFKAVKENAGDLFALFRAVWQRHRRTGYIISGSRIDMLNEMTQNSTSPFFGHFELMPIPPFDEKDARRMLQRLFSGAGLAFDRGLPQEIIKFIGTNPFYLQVLGSEIYRLARHTRAEKADGETLKIAAQETLFDAGSRLYFYFDDLLKKIAGNSTLAEATLIALTEAKRITAVARELGVERGAVSTIITSLLKQEIVAKNEAGAYYVADPAFAHWLRSRSDLHLALPPLLLGTESEKAVARSLSQFGFKLVYQSKASRGTFDLLAIHDYKMIGIQCKKSELPCYVETNLIRRMKREAKKLDWRALLAIHTSAGVRFYEATKLKVGRSKTIRLDEKTRRLEDIFSIIR